MSLDGTLKWAQSQVSFTFKGRLEHKQMRFLLKQSRGCLPYVCLLQHSSSIWRQIAGKFSKNCLVGADLKQHLSLFLTSSGCDTEGDRTLARLCFAAFVWFVWRDRNYRIFRQEIKPVQCTLDEILNQVRYKIIFLNMELSAQIAAHWNFPPRLTQQRGFFFFSQW